MVVTFKYLKDRHLGEGSNSFDPAPVGDSEPVTEASKKQIWIRGFGFAHSANGHGCQRPSDPSQRTVLLRRYLSTD